MKAPVWQSDSPIPGHLLSRPSFTVPLGACDAHMHVFGSARCYPAAPEARYTLPQASTADYNAVASALGISRAVLVQPSFYGADNACLINALVQRPESCRGVVILPENASNLQLREWNEIGVRGLRLDLFKAQAQGLSLSEIRRDLFKACERAAGLGWSVDLYVPGRLCWQLSTAFSEFPCPVSIAHMGYMAPVEDIVDDCWREFVEAVQSGPIWVKLSGEYRYGPGEGKARATALTKALLGSIPDRLLWGSDWPNVMASPEDTGALLNRLREMCGDVQQLRDILVGNPARLYGFPQADISADAKG